MSKKSRNPNEQPDRPVYRTFPGPRGAEAPLRVAIDRTPYADLVAHAKESLNAEVCGVLAGRFCEDDEGVFVHVEAIIRGSAAAQGATQVTFTQATWEAIHSTLEHDYPKLRIVGWYHTHPGFGVEFSEMDLFIQRNFFSGQGQIALVTDPMNGAVAVAFNSPDGVTYLPRFWVDAREQHAQVPAHVVRSGKNPLTARELPPDTNGAEMSDRVQALEARVGQMIQALDEQKVLFFRFLYSVGFFLCAAIIFSVGYLVYRSYTEPLTPPKLNTYVPVPIKVGDHSIMVGLGIVDWDVPPELDAVLLKMAERKAAEAEKEKEAINTKPEAAPRSDTPSKP